MAVASVIAAPWFFWQSAYFFAKASGLATERTGTGTDPHTLSGWLLRPSDEDADRDTQSLVFSRGTGAVDPASTL